ncbi:type II toxin-antitoxin system RelE/ParE family toxin [Oleomonas cavernae]|uniref:Type II toxin-antitoxin system RelE/ParE family toxin n=1 Tax=Oleomonas cavernae TaxID=2320859 RepID=A0A418WC33_9PROT|nr:type II toxin-antitoxin system RelE/ParE family toxin [Oleomonas cavernae]
MVCPQSRGPCRLAPGRRRSLRPRRVSPGHGCRIASILRRKVPSPPRHEHLGHYSRQPVQRQVAYLSTAEIDLDALEDRLVRRAGLLVAARWINRILQRIDLIALLPNMGRVQGTIDGIELRASVVKPWVIIYEYREAEDLIVIRRIVDTRRDLQSIL